MFRVELESSILLLALLVCGCTCFGSIILHPSSVVIYAESLERFCRRERGDHLAGKGMLMLISYHHGVIGAEVLVFALIMQFSGLD